MLLASGVNFGFRRTIPHALGIGGGFLTLLLAVGLALDEHSALETLRLFDELAAAERERAEGDA